MSITQLPNGYSVNDLFSFRWNASLARPPSSNVWTKVGDARELIYPMSLMCAPKDTFAGAVTLTNAIEQAARNAQTVVFEWPSGAAIGRNIKGFLGISSPENLGYGSWRIKLDLLTINTTTRINETTATGSMIVTAGLDPIKILVPV